jgi:NNP family nitrate/nitrite transporter-like MFS transporter
MPAVFNALVKDGLTPHVAWRVAFVVPGILIVTTATALLLLTPDCPTGKWSEREAAADQALRSHSIIGGVVAVPGEISATRDSNSASDMDKKETREEDKHYADNEAHIGAEQMIEAAKGEVIRKPTFKEAMNVVLSLQTLVTGACYFCSFGAELAINSVLGNYYKRNFPALGLQGEGNWAAMFGLLNVVFRPLGGIFADFAYGKTKNVWSKRVLLHTYGVITGVFLIIIGKVDSRDKSTMFGLIAGMAFFLEGGNGLNFAYVPHVHPFANGIVSGFTGACGNLGGIVSFTAYFDTQEPSLILNLGLRHHLQIHNGSQDWSHQLPESLLDHRHHHHRPQRCRLLDQTYSKGPAWWSLNIYLRYLLDSMFMLG